jgi:aspartate racemase
MKTIGLIGGLSWESTAVYYSIINREMQRRMGGVHSAKIVLHSFDFAEIEPLQAAEKWEDARDMMIAAAKGLQRAGADFIVIASNTMHKMADAVEWQSRLPVLHIADPAAAKVKTAGLRRVGLLATAYTMEQDFLKSRLREKHGIDVIVPDADDRAIVHRVIYEELVRGIVTGPSRAVYRDVIGRLVARGAEAIVLACTEIMLLVKPEDAAVPLFDTTELHALAAVDMALG